MVATTRPLTASPEPAIDWPGLGQTQGRFDTRLHAEGEVTQNVIGLHLTPYERHFTFVTVTLPAREA